MNNIKVFSDFTCPFCYIGFSIADKLRKEDPNVAFEWFPFELEPDAPLEGYDFSDEYPIEQIENSYKRILRLGSEYGLVYNNKFKKSNTHRVHKASLYADTQGKFYQFAGEVFRANFEFGKNLGHRQVIDEIAKNVGLDVEEMNKCIDNGDFDKQMKDAHNLVPEYNIESVPTFIVKDDKQVTTLKDYEKFKQDLLV